jgi:hypothetical protein
VPPKDLHGTNIQILIKTNFIRNFGLDTKAQFIEPTDFIESIGFSDSTKSLVLLDL